MECCVPGCTSRLGQLTSKLLLWKAPAASEDFPNSVKTLERRKLLKAIEQKKVPLKTTRVCSKHFVSGQSLSPDMLPESGDSLSTIITNIPEITEEFDVPEYVSLENERKIEMDLINKYITNPICDENGYYINDHDYLGLPIIRCKTENRHRDLRYDHNYSMKESPACLYSDLRHFCNICQCNNLNLFTFNTHMMVHTMKNDVVCRICAQQFLTTSCLNNHMTTHKTICDICGAEVPTVQLTAHKEANKQQKAAFDARNVYKITQKEKVHFCIICMKSFEKNYFKHLAMHQPMKKKQTNKSDKKTRLKFIKKIIPIEKKLL